MGVTSTHIFHTIERPEADAPIIETFTREQIRDMLKACKESRAWHNREDKTNERSTADRDQAIVLLLLSTGIRASELCDIRLRDIDVLTEHLTFPPIPPATRDFGRTGRTHSLEPTAPSALVVSRPFRFVGRLVR